MMNSCMTGGCGLACNAEEGVLLISYGSPGGKKLIKLSKVDSSKPTATTWKLSLCTRFLAYSNGIMYASVTESNRVVAYDVSTNTCKRVASYSAGLQCPSGLAVHNEELFVCDRRNDRLLMLPLPLERAQDSAARQVHIARPFNITVAHGRIYVLCSCPTNVVFSLSLEGELLQRIAILEAADLRSMGANESRLFLLDKGGYEEHARIHVLRLSGKGRHGREEEPVKEAGEWWDPGESSESEEGKMMRRAEYVSGEPIYSEASYAESEDDEYDY